MHIAPIDRIRWLDPNGIEILQLAILSSQGAVTKLIRALRMTHELSIEVWITPDNTMQKGPARIVSFSRNTGRRNFILGQEGAEIEFRTRTPVSGMNGTPLKSGREIAAGKQTQIVAAYENGVEKLYIDGRQQAEKLHLPSDWIIGFKAADQVEVLNGHLEQLFARLVLRGVVSMTLMEYRSKFCSKATSMV